MSRLEEIKERYIEYEYDFNLDNEHIDWLINRVEELEEENQRLKVWYGAYNRQAKHSQKLSEENQRYKQALEQIIRSPNISAWGYRNIASEALAGDAE